MTHNLLGMALSIDQQEAYRRRYAESHPQWRPSTHVYQDLVAAHLTPESRVLDLGCGRGGVMERLHRQAGSVIGADPDHRSLREHRQPALPLSCGLAEALPYPAEAFDLVCCSWVLEHLREPGRSFAEVHRVLKGGGRFIFLTPNVRHPLIKLNRRAQWTQGWLVDRLYRRVQVDVFPAYYRANSRRKIKGLAEQADLTLSLFQFIGDPTYFAFSEPLYRLGCLFERVMPRWMRVHLVGVATAS